MTHLPDLSTPFWEFLSVNVVPLVKSLRSRGVIVSDRTIIEKLPKLYCSYLALYGVTLDNVMNAAYDLVTYLVRSREELREVSKVIEDALGEVGELARKLEKAKEMMRAEDLKNARGLLEEILNYDITKLEKAPWLKPRVEAIIKSAREYLNLLGHVKEQLAKV